MDAFDPIRDAAAGLHADIVASGADAWSPVAMIDAALQHLGLELVWLQPDDIALKGARGLFDEQSGTICCLADGGPGERALLAAHEMGHACLHAAPSACVAEDVDPSRSIEAAPVGLQRVEDYGTRERRELQANVFAREFLLPRGRARRLHIDDNFGATEIANRLGLSRDLVRQQILDALLLPLPQAVASKKPDRELPSHDASQELAAAHRGSPFQLQAGPGTGKTRTLVKRASSLLAEGVDPAAILVLTFSNRASSELAERISAVAKASAPQIWIGTFHAFGLDLLRRYHDRLNLPANPVLFDRSDAIEVLEEILPTLPLVHYRNLWDPTLILRDVVTAISRAKDELVDPVRYRELGETMFAHAVDAEARETAEKCIEVADIYQVYEDALREHGAVDFGDLVMRPALLLESDASVRTTIQLRHRHVLVDEYQDVNRASARLLRAIAGDGQRLWVVGDSRQSIYRFRGASSINMTAFSREYSNAAIDQLSINYRSSTEVVEAFASFAPTMSASAPMLPLTLVANRGGTGAWPQVRRFETLEQEAEGIAAAVRELESSGVHLRDQAVLCRSNRRLDEIAAIIEARGIPVLHLGSLFERNEIRDLLALLSLIVDSFGDGLARVAKLPRYDIPLQDVYIACARLREGEGSAIGRLSDVTAIPGLSSDGISGLKRLAQDLASVSSRASAWDALSNYLLDQTRTIAEMATRDSVADRMRGIAVWQFLNFVREQSPSRGGPPIQRTLDRVRRMVLLAEERDLRQVPAAALHMDALRLMTVHGSKGLEFEAVHVPGLTVSSFPTSNRGQRCPPPDNMIAASHALSSAEENKRAHLQEEECLFFVALSRARTHLRLSLARRQPNGKNRAASEFLDRIAGRIRENANPPTLALPTNAPRPEPIIVTWPADWHVTDRGLTSYEKCPRRFFYTHVLGLGGGRNATAFSRTHDCLYELISWLATTRLSADADLAATEAQFQRIWDRRGPTDHAFANQYHHLASRLVAALVRYGAGRRFRAAEPLAIDFPNGRVIVEPDEMADLPDGTVVLRRVRTGYKRKDEYDRLEYTLYHLAARSRFGSTYRFEVLHLADETIEAVVVSPQKLSNRRNRSDELVARIAAGHFPVEVDSVTCPRCPHFFVCDAKARGPLRL